MGSDWRIVAFPVILPWRQEFWTLPLYFPDLKVGVTPGWPSNLPYQGLPLPPEAEVPAAALKGFQPGELRQWQAFKEFHQDQEEGDLLQALRQYGAAPVSEPSSPADAWRLAWQLEKMLADQEAQLVSVDRGQEWLAEILAPEPWEEQPHLGPVPGIGEMVDPDLAKLRYHLWERVMASYLHDHWAPLLLGRTARSLFLTLRGWPEWTGLRAAQVPLPGCRSEEEWARVKGDAKLGGHLAKFGGLLSSALAKAVKFEKLSAAARQLQDFVEGFLAPNWPHSPRWNLNLEIWGAESQEEEAAPVLCWTEAGAGVLPG